MMPRGPRLRTLQYACGAFPPFWHSGQGLSTSPSRGYRGTISARPR